MSDTVVFLGPSLPRSEAALLLDADYLPPIRRGDLAALPDGVLFVGIVDGEFYQSLAVSTKEILLLLRRGVSVFGASSMGALRAAETYTFGMIGVGEIFAMYRDGVLDADDEVALTYDPVTFRTLSDPLVNLRYALSLAVEAGVIGEEDSVGLIEQLRALYFPHRSYRALQALCPALVPFFRDRSVPDLKREDARQLLSAMAAAKIQLSKEGSSDDDHG